MLAVNLTGTKEIIVYVVVIVVILIAAVWYSRGRSRG
jgi:FtsZ-interacting cell division protein ZipA